MRASRTRVMAPAVVLLVATCLPATASALPRGWEVLEEIWSGVQFFRISNKTYHRVNSAVRTKRTYARCYTDALRAAGHARLADALEEAYRNETAAIARANMAEIRRVRHAGRNLAAFLSGRHRRIYDTARSAVVMQKSTAVQDAILDRRLLETQARATLEREGAASTVEIRTSYLLRTRGVDPKAARRDLEKDDAAWTSGQTLERLKRTQQRIAANRAAAQDVAAASATAPVPAGGPGAVSKPPPMVADSDTSAGPESGKLKPPQPGSGGGGETGGSGKPESGEHRKPAAAAFSCDIAVDKLAANGIPVECFERIEARRESCLEGCRDDPECIDSCNTACDAARQDLCIAGFTCEFEMSTLFGAGDRTECFEKVEAQRGWCLERCEGDPACEAVCNGACDQVREKKCVPMQDVFSPGESHD